MPLVGENLYVRTLRNRNISYYIRQRQFDNQNSKPQKPDISPRHSSLVKQCIISPADISTQPSSNRDIFITPDNAFTQMSPPTLTLRHDQMNLTSRLTDQEKSERSLQVHRQDHDNTIMKTIPRSQSQTLVKDVGLGIRKNNGNGMVKTSSDQIPQLGFDRQNIARGPHKYYGQVTCNDKLQA